MERAELCGGRHRAPYPGRNRGRDGRVRAHRTAGPRGAAEPAADHPSQRFPPWKAPIYAAQTFFLYFFVVFLVFFQILKFFGFFLSRPVGVDAIPPPPLLFTGIPTIVAWYG